MKTWQMIKALTENPKLRFVNNKSKEWERYAFISNGYIVLENKFGERPTNQFFENLWGNVRPDDEWELIREPVPFMEAVKAYAEGKTISVKGPGYRRIYRKIHESQNAIKDQNGLAVGQKEILEGEWYIEE